MHTMSGGQPGDPAPRTRAVAVRRYADIEAEWDELALRLNAPPFIRPGWFRAWHDAFGDGNCEAMTVAEGGRLLGVAPIIESWTRLRAPVNYHTPFFTALGADDTVLRELSDALLARVNQRLEVRAIRTDDQLLAVLRSDASDRGMRVNERPMMRSPYVPIRGSWDDYERGLSKNLRKNLRRRRRRLEALGAATVTMHTGVEDLPRYLDEAFHVEAAGWKGAIGTAMKSRTETRQFYTEVAEWAAKSGDLRISFLRVGGKPIAVDYSLESGSVYYSLKTGYDARYREYGPGAELTRALIERAFEERLDRFALLGATDEFKRAWAGDNVREAIVFQAFAPGPLGTIDSLVQRHGRELATRARSRLLRTRDTAARLAISTSGPWIEGAPLALSLV
jgi:CelD/BcsL family acetyltransferase involved in cellulose biosynthesis